MLNIPHLDTALTKVAIPLAGIAIVIFVLRSRKLSLADHLGLRKPPAGQTALWLLLYVTLMLGSNYFMNWRGPWDFTGWKEAPLVVDILRVLAVGILGPIVEELVFRGILYTRLAQSRLTAPGAIAVTALVWGAMHYKYSTSVVLLLFCAGLLLGTARWQTRSVITPILMHITWNLFAVW